MNEVTKSWLAAAIDFEGSLIFRKVKNNRISYGIFLGNTYKDLVKKTADILGSKVTLAKLQPNRQQYYITNLGSHQKVSEILQEILPYLIYKKEKARKMIESIKTTNWRSKYGKLPLGIEDKIIIDYKNNLSIKNIAKKHKLCSFTIYKVLDRRNIKLFKKHLSK